jgi:Asp-tRNA(Asn)/Glu-tRNA(Gln) amidotransferase A subunit family amidase
MPASPIDPPATWQGDACSLVDAYRSGERSPIEEVQATLDAIGASNLNAFSHVHAEQALEAAARADVSKPFGGVPIGVKELDQVAGWPDTHACAVFRDKVAGHTSTNVARARDLGGAVLIGQTTASEFGGVNVTRTVLNGPPTTRGSTGGPPAARRAVRRRPWRVGSSRSRPVATAAARSASRPGSPGSSA